MSDDDLKAAQLLLEYFDAARIGDGNLAAGANTLAAMALTLSNVQRPGVGVVWSADGSRIAVGSGFVMAGSLGSSLVDEHVLGPLRSCQSSLCGHVRHYGETIQNEQKVAEIKGRPLDANVDSEDGTEPVVLRELMRPSMLKQDDLGKAMRLLDQPSGGNLREIQDHPLVFGNADSPAAFELLMGPAHLGSPLLHVALHEPGDSQSYAAACNRLMDGCHLPEAAGRTVRGRVMVSDPRNMLAGALKAGGAGAGWLSRIPWLVDNTPGPGFESILKRDSSGRLDKVVRRFNVALRHSWAERLSDACEGDSWMKFDFGAKQRTWVRFLTGYEASFPGITGILRPLFASLLYGLWRMVKIDDPHKDFNCVISTILPFSQMLALRMVNSSQAMLHDSRRARHEALAESVRIKLSGGPLTIREIIRRSHRLLVSDCEGALDLLLSKGQARCIGNNRWEQIQKATAAAPAQPLTVDV
jgi:hypothetical protein